MEKILSAHLAVRNAVLLDYPVSECCRSVLPFVDELVILCERTGDGTEDVLEALRHEWPDKVRIAWRPWWNRSRAQFCIGDAQNAAIEMTEGRYHLQLQADEVYHEREMLRVRKVAEEGTCDAATFSKLNFWSSFKRVIRTPRVPKEITWLGRRSLYPALRSISDGFSLGTPDSNPPAIRILDLRLEVRSFHYGYVRKPAALVEKFRHMMDELYGWGVPVPLQDGLKSGRVVWTDLVPESELEDFLGNHPASMQGWISERSDLVEMGICVP